MRLSLQSQPISHPHLAEHLSPLARMYLAAEAGLAELAGLTKLTELADLAETEDPPPPPPEDQWHDYIWLSSSNRWSACRRDLKWQNMTT